MEEIVVYGQKINYFVHSLLCECNDHTDNNCLKPISCCSFIIIPSQLHFSITCLFLSTFFIFVTLSSRPPPTFLFLLPIHLFYQYPHFPPSFFHLRPSICLSSSFLHWFFLFFSMLPLSLILLLLWCFPTCNFFLPLLSQPNSPCFIRPFNFHLRPPTPYTRDVPVFGVRGGGCGDTSWTRHCHGCRHGRKHRHELSDQRGRGALQGHYRCWDTGSCCLHQEGTVNLKGCCADVAFC